MIKRKVDLTNLGWGGAKKDMVIELGQIRMFVCCW